MHNRILFIGSYLSQKQGTQSPTELIASGLEKEGIRSKLVSRHPNAFVRLVQCAYAIAFGNYSHVVIDVYSNLAFIYTWVGVWLARIRNKSIQLNLHGGKLTEFASEYPRIVIPTFQKASIITTPSKFLQTYFMNQEIDVHYLPNPINLHRFPYKRNHVKPYSILWVRAFHPIYNPEFAINLLAGVMEKYPQATLTMVGPDQGELQTCLDLITKLNLGHKITITGSVANDKLADYYQTHSVFINTTSYESFGMAVLEAASCGAPTISFAVGEIPFIWEDGKSILTAPLKDLKSFQQKIDMLFVNAELAQSLSSHAQITAQKFDWSETKIKWLNILNNIHHV